MGNEVKKVTPKNKKVVKLSPSIVEEALKMSFADNMAERADANVVNVSHWLPKMADGLAKSDSNVLIPDTVIVTLDKQWNDWMYSDRYLPEEVDKFGQYLREQAGDFLDGKDKVFVRSGVCSSKFTFTHPLCTDISTIGKNALEVFYFGLFVGAGATKEIVLREYVESGRPQIYSGMPLRTEFRVFYDFDQRKLLGVANYWHPDYMNQGLKGEDLDTYTSIGNTINRDFDECKHLVCSEVVSMCEHVEGMEGAWSIDVMKDGDKYWLIDLATMHNSALVDVMETVDSE